MSLHDLDDRSVPGADAPTISMRVLIVEDDLGDATLVRELLIDSDASIGILVARSVAEARVLVGGVDCVLLDLGLPDAQGLEALEQILDTAPQVAVVVLTGLADRALALAAVAAGAQDYLGKDELESRVLTRSVGYAVERKRADQVARQLFARELVAAESARLERGLLPRPLLGDHRVAWSSRYRPGGGSLLLGGDFFDAVERDDGTIRFVIGDVCGHGPDEAAVGVALRIAWRSLVLAGTADADMLVHLQAILRAERTDADLFVTACDATIDVAAHRLSLRLAGHPPPIGLTSRPSVVAVNDWGPPLGVLDQVTWPTVTVALPSGWALLFYTDGIVEGRRDNDHERWGVEGLLDTLGAAPWHLGQLDELADRLIVTAEQANGGPLADDVALFLVAASHR
jgi:serine phosphatase RsbU (regulator of sigma subunit)